MTDQTVSTGQTKIYRSVHGDGGYLLHRGSEVSPEDFAQECERVCRDYEREKTGRTAVMSGAGDWREVDTGQR